MVVFTQTGLYNVYMKRTTFLTATIYVMLIQHLKTLRAEDARCLYNYGTVNGSIIKVFNLFDIVFVCYV